MQGERNLKNQKLCKSYNCSSFHRITHRTEKITNAFVLITAAV